MMFFIHRTSWYRRHTTKRSIIIANMCISMFTGDSGSCQTHSPLLLLLLFFHSKSLLFFFQFKLAFEFLRLKIVLQRPVIFSLSFCWSKLLLLLFIWSLCISVLLTCFFSQQPLLLLLLSTPSSSCAKRTSIKLWSYILYALSCFCSSVRSSIADSMASLKTCSRAIFTSLVVTKAPREECF